jgi:RimJ/RimL family protein N-acetyltransferase
VRPPESLAAGELVIRRYQASDAPLLHAAIERSVDHLRPWMPWIAAEPLSVEDRERLIVGDFAKGWDDETDFVYGIFLSDEVVGGCGLHRRIAADGIEIGYWIGAGHTGRGLATAVARALCDAAFALDGITHVEIHHDKANAASGRVPGKLGFRLVREVDDHVAAPGETGRSCEWRLDRPGP